MKIKIKMGCYADGKSYRKGEIIEVEKTDIFSPDHYDVISESAPSTSKRKSNKKL